MAKYDYLTPKDILQSIEQKKKSGHYVYGLNDKKALAQWYEAIAGGKDSADQIYNQIREDLKKPLIKMPETKSSYDLAHFLISVQNKDSGSWTQHPTKFHIELERAKQILTALNSHGLKPKYELTFLNKVRTGKKLKSYFKSLLYNFNINNADELNLGFTTLYPIYELGVYDFSQDWKSAFFECLNEWQDKKTGYWGPWLKKNKQITKLPELSITFHILRRFFDAKKFILKDPKYVPKCQKKIIATTWRLKNKDYPYGWLEKGSWSTHHNYDVVDIFNMLFYRMNKKEKTNVRRLCDDLLCWCLGECLQKNGGFTGYYPDKKTPTMLSTNFAVLLLHRLGYFDGLVRKTVWSSFDFKINSYRVYEGKPPENEFDTSRLKAIYYPKSFTNPDPLETRAKIHRFWKKNKGTDPTQALHTNSILLFDKYTVTEIMSKKAKSAPIGRIGEFVVAVDKYGGIISIKIGRDTPKR